MEINALPPKMREIFIMSRNQSLSYREISEQLDITEHTVKKQISNAIKLLRIKLRLIFLLGI
jgi:RNA polymerase sigma-70 factor (ECF subfamily)